MIFFFLPRMQLTGDVAGFTQIFSGPKDLEMQPPSPLANPPFSFNSKNVNFLLEFFFPSLWVSERVGNLLQAWVCLLTATGPVRRRSGLAGCI